MNWIKSLFLRFLPGFLPESVKSFLHDRRVRVALAVVVATLAALKSTLPQYAPAIDWVMEALAALGIVGGVTVPTPANVAAQAVADHIASQPVSSTPPPSSEPVDPSVYSQGG